MEWGAVSLWAGMFLILSLLGLPLTAGIFAQLPGRGAGFAPTAAIGIVSLIVYWAGHVYFGPIVLVLSLLVLIIASSLTFYQGVDLNWKAFAESMSVFYLGFFFIIAIRAVDPALTPFNEDFLDYGMLRSLQRADSLPPIDFWFAGERVRYHYGGHLIAALETSLTGTPPSIAYNLAQAGFFGMLLSGTYEIAGSVAATRGRRRRVGGFGGVYFVGFAGNLLVPIVAITDALPKPIKSIVKSPIANDLGKSATKFLIHGFAEFHYWDVLEIIPDALTLFPMFAWLNGELHANMTSAPFLILTIGICFAYYRTPETKYGRRRLLALIMFPLAAGFTILCDVMATPTVLGIFFLTLVFAPAAPASIVPAIVRSHPSNVLESHGRIIPTDEFGLHKEAQRIGLGLLCTLVLTVAIIGVTTPFLVHISGSGGESFGYVPLSDRTGVFGLLIVHGVFLVLFALDLIRQSRPLVDKTTHDLYVAAVTMGLVLTGLMALARAPVLLLVAPLIFIGWYVLHADRDRFEIVLIIAGAGLVLLVDFVYIASQEYVITGRGNTVFRAYWHTWLVWGIAAGIVLSPFFRVPDNVQFGLLDVRMIQAIFVLSLVVSTAAYGGVSLYGHFDRAFEEPQEPGEQAEYVYEATQMQDGPMPPTEPPTLDSLLYAQVKHPNETAAIIWLDNRVEGTPTIVTAPGGRWEWRSTAAALTGLPTVAGWAHQLVYRDWKTYYSRVEDVRTIYTGSPSRRITLLRQYDVEYVYVGFDERRRFDIWEFSILDGVKVAYMNPDVAIYHINQTELNYTPKPVTNVRYGVTDLGVNWSVAARENGSIVSMDPDTNRTLAWFGPYATLPPGRYVATFRLAVNTTNANPQSNAEPVVIVDVARGAKPNGTADYRVLANASVNETAGIQSVTVPFTLSQPALDVEFRGWLANGTGTAALHDVTLKEVPLNETDRETDNG